MTYALIAHELNNFQSSHFVQLFNFKEDLPIVDVPTEKEYYRRKLTKECKTLKDDRTQEINRLHALFLQCGITTMKRSNLQTDANRQKVLPQLFGYEVGQAKRVCERLTLLEAQIKELEQTITKECKADKDIEGLFSAAYIARLKNTASLPTGKHRLSTCARYAHQCNSLRELIFSQLLHFMERLQTIPGGGDKTALAFTAYVGDGKRFNNGDEVANYLGLVPRVDCSGSINRYGHITKKGNRIVRALLYQAAWSIVRSKHGGALKAKYFYMTEHGMRKEDIDNGDSAKKEQN